VDAPACRGGRRKGREEGIKGGGEEVDRPEGRETVTATLTDD